MSNLESVACLCQTVSVFAEESGVAPQAFISHASADKDRFVRPFASELRTEHGVDAWLDEWEIRPGDSLVQRIFPDAIGRADALIVVVSDASVDSPWVREELDAATLRKIADGTRLVPVILDGLEHDRIPLQLHHLAWVRGDGGVESAARRTADAIFGRNPAKPALGEVPLFTQTEVRVQGLDGKDVAVLLAIGDRCLDNSQAFVGDAASIAEEVAAAGVDYNDFTSVARFLFEKRLLETDPIGMGGSVTYFSLSRRGVRAYLRARGHDLDNIQRHLVGYVVNQPTTPHHYKTVAEAIGAPPLAVAVIAEDLGSQRMLRVSKAMGDSFEFGWPSESLRRSAR